MTVDLGATVLVMDELITHPDGAAVLDALANLVPTALADQFDAAAGDVARAAEASVDAGLAGPRVPLPAAGHPGWVRLALLDTIARWVTGRARTCMCSPDPLHPQPVFACAWRPGLVTCATHAYLFVLPAQSAAAHTCDACGRVCAGLDAGHPIWSAAVQCGPMTFEVGCCTDCRYWPGNTPQTPVRGATSSAGAPTTHQTTARKKH